MQERRVRERLRVFFRRLLCVSALVSETARPSTRGDESTSEWQTSASARHGAGCPTVVAQRRWTVVGEQRRARRW